MKRIKVLLGIGFCFVLLVQSFTSSFIEVKAVSTGTEIYGDYTNDGKVDSGDYVYLRRYLLRIISDFPNSNWRTIGDLNSDAKVDSGDYVILRRFLLRQITVLPYGASITPTAMATPTTKPTSTPTATPTNKPTSTPTIKPSIAPTSTVDIPCLSKEEIKTLWSQLKPQATDDAYLEKPSIVSPYSAGKLKTEFLNDGLNMANFCRALANIPYDLELDDTLCEDAQYASVLLAANDILSHTPPQPTDMPKDFYDRGYKTTSTSNLAGGNIFNLYSTIQMYTSDSDPSNIAKVGHRRWVLNPALKKTGFGYADIVVPDGYYPSAYSAMKAFDSSININRSESFDYNCVLWPNKNFPVEFFDYKDAWSITMNPNKYNNSKISEITVALTRISDGKVWSFDSTNKDVNGKYFSVDNLGYGVPYCIIFRPDIDAIKDGDKFNVTVSGLYNKAGTKQQLSYDVEFFSMN